MRLRSVLLSVLLMAGLSFARKGLALDFFFEPDTSFGYVGDTLLVSGWIGPSDSMRGFTVYLAYDTNCMDLTQPVTPGSLIAEQEDLEFHYFDHTYQPDLLEVGATVWSSDFWAGPGELFRLHLELRQCADAAITAQWPPLFVDSHGEFPEVVFHQAIVFVRQNATDRPFEVSRTPFEVSMIYPNPSNSSFAICFSVQHSLYVEIQIYDVLGQHTARIASSVFHAGTHSLRWNAENLASGIYIVVFSGPTFQVAKKLILSK